MDFNIDLNKSTNIQEVKEYKGGKDKDIQELLKEKSLREDYIRKDLINNPEWGQRFKDYTISEFDNVFYMVAPKGKNPTGVLVREKNGEIFLLYTIKSIKEDDEKEFGLYTTAKKVLLKEEPKAFIIGSNGERLGINENYYKYWNNISFYTDVGWIRGIINSEPQNRGKVSINEEYLKSYLITGTIKPMDMLDFKSYGELSEELFNKYFIESIKGLGKQISDLRFSLKGNGERLIGLEITKKELDSYLKNELITKEYYNKCLGILEKREKLIKEIQESNEKTGGQLKIEKEKKGFLDRVMSILN